MGTHVNYSGLVIAGVGFFLTRFTVTLAIYEDPLRFYLAGIVPLTLGLGLAAFGVALAVAGVDRATVRTTALWCVVGAGAMAVLVLLTLFGSTTGDMTDLTSVRSRTYLSNFLIGGSVGGTLTGLYASRNRRQRRTLEQQANRLEVLNRLLRHEVLNALTAIRGYASLPEGREEEAQAVIARRSDAIESTIEEVRYLTENPGTEQTIVGPLDVEEYLDECVEAVRDRYPNAQIVVEYRSDDATVLASDRLRYVFTHLIENAVEHASTDDPTVEVAVSASATDVRVSVSDEGPGLPENQQKLLETGDIGEFDNPGTGFSLNVVRFLVENYRGSVETAVDGDGTTISVVLPRAPGDEPERRPMPSELTGVRPVAPNLLVTLVAALIAGVVYGVASEMLGGSIAFIGVFYGTASPVVGWITHEFHSVVFGFVFAGLISLAPSRYRNDFSTYLAIGIAWGLVLWVVAAGVIAPVWLQLLGIDEPVPNLDPELAVTHLVWGISLGVLSATGYERATPWLTRVNERVRL